MIAVARTLTTERARALIDEAKLKGSASFAVLPHAIIIVSSIEVGLKPGSKCTATLEVNGKVIDSKTLTVWDTLRAIVTWSHDVKRSQSSKFNPTASRANERISL